MAVWLWLSTSQRRRADQFPDAEAGGAEGFDDGDVAQVDKMPVVRRGHVRRHGGHRGVCGAREGADLVLIRRNDLGQGNTGRDVALMMQGLDQLDLGERQAAALVQPPGKSRSRRSDRNGWSAAGTLAR